MDDSQAKQHARTFMQRLMQGDQNVIARADHNDTQTVAFALSRSLLRLPEDTVAAAVWEENDPPHLVAVSSDHRALYRLSPRSYDRPKDRAPWITVQGRALDRSSCSVEVSSQSIRHMEADITYSEWNFRLGDEHLTFESAAGPDLDDHSAEQFGLALAAAIGAPLR